MCLVQHADDDNLALKDMIKFHAADWKIAPAWGFLTCGWKTFFEQQHIRRYVVTGMSDDGQSQEVLPGFMN
jgi:hypothetical protein